MNHVITELYNHFENKNQNSFKDIYLGKVFEKLVNENRIYANGFMHINFVIYDKNGLRIRDILAHGNYPSMYKDITVFLLVAASLIHAVVVRNKYLGTDDGK